MQILIFIASLVALSQAVTHYDLIREEWNLFKVQYKKQYQSETEENYRMKIYMENKRLILRHNQRYEEGLVTFKLGVNQFADLLLHEFISQMTGYNSSQSVANGKQEFGSTYIPPENVVPPDSVDWRTKGAVTPVKDQKDCLSCWAFSATGALEAQHFRKTGKLISLSEQNLIDCTTDYGNSGCGGGWVSGAYLYIKDNDGIDTEESYPYEDQDAECRYDPKNKGASDTGAMILPPGNEYILQLAVATMGPPAVYIDISHPSFQHYMEGVYYEPECSAFNLLHAVLVVGYGTSEGGDDYWLVKNSWGDTWGDGGYIKMSRNKNNNCGIATQPTLPIV